MYARFNPIRYPSKTITARHGENSFKKKIIGSPGEDTIIPVPLGITIYSEHTQIGNDDTVFSNSKSIFNSFYLVELYALH